MGKVGLVEQSQALENVNWDNSSPSSGNEFCWDELRFSDVARHPSSKHYGWETKQEARAGHEAGDTTGREVLLDRRNDGVTGTPHMSDEALDSFRADVAVVIEQHDILCVAANGCPYTKVHSPRPPERRFAKNLYDLRILHGQGLFGFISRTMVNDYDFQIVMGAGSQGIEANLGLFPAIEYRDDDMDFIRAFHS